MLAATYGLDTPAGWRLNQTDPNAQLALASVSAAIAVIVANRPRTLRAYLPLGVTVALVGCLAVWGALRTRSARLTTTGDGIRVGLIQGNVDQADKWNDQRAATIFRRYLEMTRQAVSDGAAFVGGPQIRRGAEQTRE